MTRDTMPQVAKYWNDIAEQFDSIYTGRKSAVGRALDRWLRQDMFGRFEWVMRKAGNARDLTVCDIGCGSGRFVTELAKRGAKRVVGVDVAPEMIRLARELVQKDGVSDRCEFTVADIENWTTDERFDFVIAIGFWDYIADPRSRLRKIRGITKGTFLSAWPRAETWRAPVRKARLTMLGCPVYFYRHDDVRKLLTEAGFAIRSEEVIGQLYCVEATTPT
jgi:2-polyprenyl-3-methyl-5-hydroxy-6-metoxy-1,4-benzoquinol methylase